MSGVATAFMGWRGERGGGCLRGRARDARPLQLGTPEDLLVAVGTVPAG